ncbi:hypothetical protein EST38_g7895 [Candolleomyces aberdarensis]|uniref:Uncharacterized protein n=1 Tax=Candolleomyces aberdarensis TaxID=2316362 RepID=A0A4Q2DG05_9AGAR|nr:hypothetical protein EST38_g7895 [Candolleomyces aberdarensis]
MASSHLDQQEYHQRVVEAVAKLEEALKTVSTLDPNTEPAKLITIRRYLVGKALIVTSRIWRWMEILGQHNEYLTDESATLDLSLFRVPPFTSSQGTGAETSENGGNLSTAGSDEESEAGSGSRSEDGEESQPTGGSGNEGDVAMDVDRDTIDRKRKSVDPNEEDDITEDANPAKKPKVYFLTPPPPARKTRISTRKPASHGGKSTAAGSSKDIQAGKKGQGVSHQMDVPCERCGKAGTACFVMRGKRACLACSESHKGCSRSGYGVKRESAGRSASRGPVLPSDEEEPAMLSNKQVPKSKQTSGKKKAAVVEDIDDPLSGGEDEGTAEVSREDLKEEGNPMIPRNEETAEPSSTDIPSSATPRPVTTKAPGPLQYVAVSPTPIPSSAAPKLSTTKASGRFERVAASHENEPDFDTPQQGLAHLHDCYLDVEGQVADVRGQVRTLRREMDTVVPLKATIASASDKVDEAVEEMRTRQATIEHEVEQVRENIKAIDLRNTVVEVREKVTSLEQGQAEELGKLKEELTSLQEEIASLRSQLVEAKAKEGSNRGTRLEEMESELASLRLRLDSQRPVGDALTVTDLGQVVEEVMKRNDTTMSEVKLELREINANLILHQQNQAVLLHRFVGGFDGNRPLAGTPTGGGFRGFVGSNASPSRLTTITGFIATGGSASGIVGGGEDDSQIGTPTSASANLLASTAASRVDGMSPPPED